MKNLPKIIQGGMGVAISDWKLAKAVSGLGQLGVVSGTGLGNILIARLMDGDLEGHVRRALSHFPFQESVQKVIEQYYVPGGKAPDQSYKRPPMWVIKPPKFLNELTVVANFVEVFLAKEDHGNPVGINLLEKVQMPNISSLYGAMLAGVNFVIIGAGIPTQIPGILDSLAEHQAVSYRLEVVGQKSEEETRIHFDPEAVFPGISEKMGQLTRPWFLPIISSVVLGQALLKRATGKIDGFVVELPTAGGHNAPPRGVMKLDEQGEPIYGKKDDVNLEKIKKLDLPFWLAGSYGSPEKYREALDAGAAGIQVGTLFAYCNESGMEKKAKQALLKKALQGKAIVRTSPVASPTGFPFKVVALEGTLSEKDVYESRPRICDMGFLRHIYRQANGRLGYRCPAEPVEHYVKKEGDADDTINRTCLCNNLFASAGYPQYHDYGYVEPPIITSGDEFVNINRFINPEQPNYSAEDVIKHLTGEN